MDRSYDAVLFDLLTALLDLLDAVEQKVAGNPEDGKRWRTAYLRNTYGVRGVTGLMRHWSQKRPRKPVYRDGWRMTSPPAMPRWSPGPEARGVLSAVEQCSPSGDRGEHQLL